ncbi:MAG TPA: glycoside hydrolase family 3 N-terminal domain-containing protein [Bacteroidales bacterium]|jgi:beta-glucosidase|nr:glycoside hydrolase family 3 N-terminal domain-containing protein [Bacteroidales bacterium]HOG56315.1 glycoside hydrolase family 3 N-terminal domain-containing protein [Bacteroidales bacterium]HPX44493.1 glycoside hydrolase family 3 N-terminal domain-containing protein [Bacteroidales bacterium]HQB86939.1 glycoside hydrolase family 3 N-terminal domain-containing protein [Bacteroidales bacterium]
MKTLRSTLLLFAATLLFGLFTDCSDRKAIKPQPVLGTRSVNIIEKKGLQFKDLNKNGELDPYEDWRLPDSSRIADLLGQMTLEEKVGLLFHPNIAVPADGVVKYDFTEEEKAAMANAGNETYAGPIGPGGQGPAGGGIGQMRRTATAKSFIEEKHFRNILNNGVAPVREFASWSNKMQEIAEATRLGIPIMFSTDPRHGATLGAHVSGTQYFSQWPSKEGQVGISSAHDTVIMKKFGEVVAEEYRAVGLHMILGPQIDVMTEPRWSRNMGCFSEDADLTAEMLAAFMDGAQGKDVGPEKILVHLKHWPGAGPHKDGTGQWLTYPGNNFDYHLIPWKKGIEKGALAAMGYYSGTFYDSLNVNYSYHVSTEILYNQLGFKGAICTDWGVVGRGPLKPSLQGKTTLKDNMEMIINAGVDQMGSETNNQLVLELVKEGRVSEERINQAAGRILQWHFILGLFENPYVDPEAATKIVRSEKNQKLGYEAQLKSIVLLVNEGVLPAAENIKIYVEGIDKEIAAGYATVVDDPGKADLILIRTTTEEERSFQGFGGGMPGAGPRPGQANAPRPQMNAAQAAAAMNPFAPREVNIDFPAKKWANIKTLARTGKPVVVAFNPTGSSCVLPADLRNVAKGAIMIFDALDNALLDIVFGKFKPVGKLTFEIPSSMDAVKKQLEDLPFDSENPAFKFGDGLSYSD